MTKKRIIVYIIFVTIIGIYFYRNKKNIENNIQEQLSWSIIFTGNVFSWDSNNTWETNITSWSDISLTDYENFKKLLDNPIFIRKFNPPKQPDINSTMSYEEKSNLLNEYLKDNNFYFRNSQKINNWYLYIKLNKNLISNWDIFIYFHDTKINWYTVSWKLAKEENLIENNSKEFLYKLDSIQIRKFYDGKLLDYKRLFNELNYTKKLHYIWWYTTTSDWNFIQEIIIVWE